MHPGALAHVLWLKCRTNEGFVNIEGVLSAAGEWVSSTSPSPHHNRLDAAAVKRIVVNTSADTARWMLTVSGLPAERGGGR
jgi:hypothetical protein